MNSPVGRFAPSPTGPLHMGSLLTAVASYLDIKSRNGTWLVRMEDIDPPREMSGADQAIVDSLKAHGLIPDLPMERQSAREPLYIAAQNRLLSEGKAFYCQCSRRDLAPDNGVHHRDCGGTEATIEDAAIRLRCQVGDVGFVDGLQGDYQQHLGREVGDFILRRRDGLVAYQLAVVVDDADQGIDEVMRGIDLIDSTPRQIYLQRQLRLPTPRHIHLPVIVNEFGQKLSKQHHAPAICDADALANLKHVLGLLGQEPRHESTISEVLTAAARDWRRNRIPSAAELR